MTNTHKKIYTAFFGVVYVLTSVFSFFSVSQHVFASSTMTIIELTSDSVLLNATGLIPNETYEFEILRVGGSLTAQVTTDATGMTSASFNGLSYSHEYTANIFKYNTTTHFLTSSGIAPLQFRTLGPDTLGAANLTATSVTIRATRLIPGNTYQFQVSKTGWHQEFDAVAGIDGNAEVQFTGLISNTPYTGKVFGYNTITHVLYNVGMPELHFITHRPSITTSDLTTTSVTLNADGLVPYGTYMFKLQTPAGLVEGQATASATGNASAPFTGLVPSQSYIGHIYKYDTNSQLSTSSGIPAVFFVTPAETPPPPPPPNQGGTSTGTSSSTGGDMPDPDAIIPCDGTPASPCGFPELMILIQRIINYLLFYMVLPIAAILCAYIGFLFVTSGANPGNRQKAKDMIPKFLFGLVIALAAWLIVKVILTTLGYDDSTGAFPIVTGQ